MKYLAPLLACNLSNTHHLPWQAHECSTRPVLFFNIVVTVSVKSQIIACTCDQSYKASNLSTLLVYSWGASSTLPVAANILARVP